MQFCNIAFREPLKNQNKEFVEALKEVADGDILVFSNGSKFELKIFIYWKCILFWNDDPSIRKFFKSVTNAQIINLAVEKEGLSLLQLLDYCFNSHFFDRFKDWTLFPDVVDVKLKKNLKK